MPSSGLILLPDSENCLKGEFDMSKKDKPIRVKLIANPGAGNDDWQPHALRKLQII